LKINFEGSKGKKKKKGKAIPVTGHEGSLRVVEFYSFLKGDLLNIVATAAADFLAP
jgi:hypothetical protein